MGNHGRGLPWISLPLAHGLLSQRPQWPTPAEPARLGGTEGSLGIAQRPQATPWTLDLRRVPEELVRLREDLQHHAMAPRHGSVTSPGGAGFSPVSTCPSSHVPGPGTHPYLSPYSPTHVAPTDLSLPRKARTVTLHSVPLAKLSCFSRWLPSQQP